MKNLFFLIALCAFIGCEKADLEKPVKKDARSVQTEEVDSVVKPDVEYKGWEGEINVGFDF